MGTSPFTMDKAFKHLKFPPKGASAEDLKKFKDRFCDFETSRRREWESEWLLAKAMSDDNHQWLTRTRSWDPRRTPRFFESTREDIPKPVVNRIFQIVDNERARLGKRNSEVYVDPSSSSPASRTASKIGTDVIDHHLNDPDEGIRWQRKRRKGLHHFLNYGTQVMKSYIAMDNLDTVKVGIDALKCSMPGCGTMLASPDVPKPELWPPQNTHALEVESSIIPMKKPKVTAMGCPDCASPLIPYTPAGGEEDGQDMFGRPLGHDVPRGRADVEVVSPFEMFWENEGLGVEPWDCSMWGQVTPRSLDYVKRFYSKNVDQVKPEDALTISEIHPYLGEYGAAAKGARGATERSIYKNHTRLWELYQDKTVDFPNGRMLVMAGDVVLVDDDLYIQPDPTPDNPNPEPFKKVQYVVARCFRSDEELLGHGMPFYLTSLQNRVNMTHSQIVDTREHNVGGIIAPRGLKLIREWIKGFAGYVFRYEPDPSMPDVAPRPFRTGIPDQSAWQEIQGCEEAMRDIAGMMDAEIGNNPTNVTTFSQLQLLSEKASERRQQREKELIDAYEELLQHQLRIIAHYYREPRPYRVKTDDGRGWERREFTGADIGGEYGIRIREQPQYDKPLAEREALANVLQNPALLPQTAYGKRKMAEVLGLPKDIYEESTAQMDAAQRMYFQWLRKNIPPYIDESVDDPTLRYQEIGRMLLGPDAIAQAEAIGWPAVLKLIYGWEDEYQKLDQTIQQAKSQGWKDDIPLQQFTAQQFQQEAAQFQQSMAAFKQQSQQHDATVQRQQVLTMAGQQLQTAPPPAPTPPQAPAPPPDFLPNSKPVPRCLEDKILWVLEGMITQRGGQVSPELDSYLQMRAVHFGYRMLSTQNAGGVAPQAPGTPPAQDQGQPDQGQQMQEAA